ncbi:MAG: coproporphyrinogen-III oxidase family protein [Ruminococcus callidus]
MGAGLYLHVPFCRRKCPYCNFYSVPAQPELLTAYTAAVCRNLRHYGNAAQPERVDTVYFGGGTPSLLLPAQITQILETAAEQFALSADAEITLEANPATVTPEQLRELRHAGINRLSLGVQSLSDAQLKRLGRLHTAQEAVETVYAAAEAGFRNLSCDLMLALPEQTADELEQTIREMTRLPIVHISAYLLKIEPGTPSPDSRLRRSVLMRMRRQISTYRRWNS